MISKSTGLYTRGLTSKEPLPDDKNGILVKIHARNKFIARTKALWLLPPHNFEGKYMYSYRDPRDAIISLYEMYKHHKGLSDLTPEQFLRDYDPIGQYRWEINAWVMRKHDNVLLVRFEDLKRDPALDFQRIFRFLGLDSEVDEESIKESVSGYDSTNRPRRSAQGWKSAPPEYHGLIEEISSRLDKEIRTLNYDLL